MPSAPRKSSAPDQIHPAGDEVGARPQPKGRDFYDLLWYLSDTDWPAPNLTLLNNALAQTGWRGPRVTTESWKGLIAARVRDANFESLLQDVMPFLETPVDADLLTRKDLLRLLA